MSENGRGAEWANLEALEAAIGELRETEEECPGVWYVSTGGDGEREGTEFYVVDRNADAIPNEAKAYGAEIPDCPGYLLYPMDAERQTRKIIQYEILRYRTREARRTRTGKPCSKPRWTAWRNVRRISGRSRRQPGRHTDIPHGTKR